MGAAKFLKILHSNNLRSKKEQQKTKIDKSKERGKVKGEN